MHGLLKGVDIKRLSLSNEIKEIMVPKNSEFDINSGNFLVVEYEDFEDLKKLGNSNILFGNVILENLEIMGARKFINFSTVDFCTCHFIQVCCTLVNWLLEIS